MTRPDAIALLSNPLGRHAGDPGLCDLQRQIETLNRQVRKAVRFTDQLACIQRIRKLTELRNERFAQLEGETL